MSKARDIADLGSNDVLDTSSSGIDVTGTVTTDGLTVDGVLTITENDSANNAVRMTGDANEGLIQLYKDGAEVLKFRGDGNSFINSGNVGIGTSSPNFSLDVPTGIGINEGNVLAWHDGSGGKSFDIYASSDNSLRFRVTGSSEAMRIDSSGNLLVGKTSVGVTTEGFEVRPDGTIAANRDGANAAYFGRLTSDGDIVKFYKDGTTVGSIGSLSGTGISLVTTTGSAQWGSSDAGLNANGAGNYILPWNVGSNTSNDAAIDLGAASHRFRSLYLSGGVYLGGTGSANHLDDYEEGDISSSVYDASGNVLVSGTDYTWQSNKYTKIGRFVHVTIGIRDIRATKGSLSINPPFGGITDRHVGMTYGGEVITYACCGPNAGRFILAGTNEYKYGVLQYTAP